MDEITPQSENFSQWYVDVVTRAELADYGPVKGTMVMRPYGYAIWERIQASLDRRFKATGHQNVYFPLLIPASFLQKEAQHVEGFAPEVAWVTRGGAEELAEPLAIRPTSETVVCAMYAKWIQSYRDLPLLYNQWANVVRWEKSTRPFLRTSEFLWQEGHTAHATAEEAEAEARQMLEVYRDFIENDMALAVIPGRKSESEKFAGAVHTYSVEALMRDGRALQAGTSHNLGQHFAKGFDITFLDRDGQLKHVWQSSWGVSTRLIGALIMGHGDEKGLVLPPKLAPVQVVVVPIAPGKEREAVLTRVRQLSKSLGEVYRIHLDDREEVTPGYKFNDWEMRGVPLRLEVGPRDMKAGQAVLVRRDTGAKATVPAEELPTVIGQILGEIQDGLLRRSRAFLQERTQGVRSREELAAAVSGSERGMAIAGWCGDGACEAAVKEETGATIRNLPFQQEPVDTCVVCGQPARHQVVFARAY